jgi:hypothetical protein
MKRSGWTIVMLAWMAILVFVYPIPHTIALRNLLLLAGLLLCAAQSLRSGDQSPTRHSFVPLRTPLILLGALSAWLVINSAFLSRHAEEALQLLRGDWLVALLVAFIGGWAAKREGCESQAPLVNGLCAALFAHSLWLLGYQLFFWISTGQYPPMSELTPFAQRDYHSSLFTMLSALLAAEGIARALNGRRMLGISTRLLMIALAVNLAATMLLQTRNAVLITIALVLACVGVLIRERRILENRTRRWAGYSVVFAACLAIGGVFADLHRWNIFVDTASVAIDTRGHLSWQNLEKFPLPVMSNGNPVEVSAYSRIAWAKVALEQIIANPLGVGFGHKAFGWAVNDAYGIASGLESSHSGVLDFTLANGIPGMVLWFALCAALMRLGWRAFGKSGSPAGLMLVLTVFGYFVRCVLDGHFSGWRLEMYALVVGILVVAACRVDEHAPRTN